MKLFLASQSPRRNELMKLAGFQFENIVPQTDEKIEPEWNIRDVPELLAKQKTIAAFNQFQLNDDDVVVCADTIVLFEGKIFGKPKDETEALLMLETLSGKEHEVLTGVCIKNSSFEESFTDTSKVFFRTLSQEDLLYYIRNHNPYDKAGSYGIQDWLGVRIVERVEGDYFNVMGLPVRLVCERLKRFRVE